MKRRIAAGVEYDGSGFQGWQLQHDEPTVQLAVERALSEVADHAVRVMCAGRTDAGVHARGQVIHFDTAAQRPMHGWMMGANTNLPDSVSLLWACEVPDDFDARFSASGRTYRYQILNRPVRPALARQYHAWVRLPLDADRMSAAAEYLIGEHDFTSFRAVACQAKHARRTVYHAKVWREDESVVIDVHANAFLHHMVRNIAGSLIEVGSGERRPEWIAEILDRQDRRVAGITAPAQGLCLISVDYPERFGLTASPSARAV